VHRYAALVSIPLAAALATGACGGSENGSASSKTAPVASAGFSATECGTYSGRGCRPASGRVDLRPPSFSNPTEITNPLNPIGRLRSALLLGEVEGEPLRVETTLLPGSKTIVLGGQEVKALTSQFVAWLGGRIDEVALDWYAQDESGAVWYLGEDVFNYADGVVTDTEGTWLAGREGPAAMIMPAHPKVGDVYRPENVPGIVFEEVTVKSVGKTVRGPRGPIDGAIVVEELHLDGTREDKTFAPGYGEFRTGSKQAFEGLALAVPTDALSGPRPAELARLSTGATGMLGSAQAEDWNGAVATLERMSAAWDELRAGALPPMLEAQMNQALDRLRGAVKAHKSVRAALAAIDAGQASLDLELQYRSPVEIDRARFDLWASRILIHASADDLAGVTGDVATLEWIRDRFAHTLDGARRSELDVGLRELRAATDAKNLPAASDHAARLASRLRDLAGPDPAL
jgi:hypothetical protein